MLKYLNMKFFVIICMCFILNSCFDKDSKKDKIKLNKVEDASQIADFELEFENENTVVIDDIINQIKQLPSVKSIYWN